MSRYIKIWKRLRKKQDSEAYCSICWGVQNKDKWWVDECLSRGLYIAVEKAEQLIKAGNKMKPT